jgi:dihydropyrimidinase
MAATLIRNGRIVTAVDDYTADILMNDGRVHTIGMDPVHRPRCCHA